VYAALEVFAVNRYRSHARIEPVFSKMFISWTCSWKLEANDVSHTTYLDYDVVQGLWIEDI